MQNQTYTNVMFDFAASFCVSSKSWQVFLVYVVFVWFHFWRGGKLIIEVQIWFWHVWFLLSITDSTWSY